MSRTVTLDVGGMTCDGCASNVTKAINSLEEVSEVDVSHDSGKAIVTHNLPDDENIRLAIMNAGYSVDGESEPFNWKDGSVWRQSAHNTKWCLIGCSIGDFGTIAAFQFIPYLNALGWSAMSIMMLAMFNGIMTSIALETFILIKQMGGIREAFRVAIGMSLISMIAMETSMNATDLLNYGRAFIDVVGNSDYVVRRIHHSMAIQLLETQEVRISLSLGDLSCRTGKG